MTRHYDLHARAVRRQAALDRRAELAATGTNELTERRSLYSGAERPMTSFEKQRDTERRTDNSEWSAAEYAAMASAYIKHAGDRPAICAEFMAFSELRSYSSADIAAQVCRALDTKVKNAKGMSAYPIGLLNALNAIAPGRFEDKSV
jgi:hypothetical protein